MKRFNLMMDITVHDDEALFRAALFAATGAGHELSSEEAMDLLKPQGEIDVAACVQMLLDPGTSPGGMQIENCTVESY